MPSILLTPCDNTDYSASAELLSISPVEMQEIADRFSFDDPQFLSRLDRFEEHLNSDLTFEQYVNLMDELPCPCPTCITSSGMTTVEYAIAFLQKLQTSWAALLNVVEPYSTPPNSPIGEEFPYEPPSVSPTNREMHAMNGNHIHTKVPFIRDVADVLNGVHEAYEEIPNIIEKFRSKGKYSSDDAMRHYKKHFSNHPSGRYYDAGTPEYDEWWKLYQESLKTPQLKKTKKITNKEQHTKNGNPKWSWHPSHSEIKNTETLFDRQARGENPAELITHATPHRSGPSNKEMHSYNGNPPKMGPRTKAQHARTERKKIRNAKKRAETKAYLKVIKSGTAPFPKNRPKLRKKKTKIEKIEDRVARHYNRSVYNPAIPPPRLGSTGNSPTKLIHGFYKQIIKMDTINWGTNTTLGNATSLLAFINPKMFNMFSTTTNYGAPIVICAAASNSVVFDGVVGGPGTNTLLSTDFTNVSAMKSEVLGTIAGTTTRPSVRWLTGSVSMECRCPMATTAPPFLYGGLLPKNITESTIDTTMVSKQLSTQTGTQMENLLCTSEIQGFTGSSVYLPNTPQALDFNPNIANNDGSTTSFPATAVPYIGMNGCPTAATVVVTVSCWFEIQQIRENSYYGGWQLGPKVSSEDVFDRLSRRQTVSTRVIDQGVRQTAGPSATMQLEENLKGKETPQPTVFDEIRQLKKEISLLRLQIDSEEDEKYFDVEATPSLDKQDTPIYKGLSKSTLDLAMTLKKSLTPGSVTHKTVQSSSQ